jgi:glyoxylase-like metal-dependent hydrolase (beta-lactamase superfamily II)
MNIETLTVGAFGTNCFLVWGTSREAIVLDPGDDADRILGILREQQLTVAAYLLTHGHVDHITAVADMCQTLSAPVYIHSEDLPWAFDPDNQMPPFYSVPTPPKGAVHPLQDGEERSDAGLRYRVISTPGHTPGSVCFLFPDEHVLFSGDTLFAESVGRTDLPGGDSRALARSLARLAELDDRTVVYPGHGPATDMAHEKKHNYFLRGQ